MAVVLEAVCGWVGFLGVGYLLRGQIGTGLAMMLLWWVVIAALIFFGIFSLGASLVCVGPIWFAVPVLSALALANRSR